MHVGDAERRPLWDDLVAGRRPQRTAAPPASEAEVVVVGAGLTGLWTAYHLLRARPDRRVVVVDAQQVGAGASGRNGGWCSAESSVSWSTIAAKAGAAQASATFRALVETVERIGAVIDDEGIDAGWAHGGSLHAARNAAQAARLQDGLVAARKVGDTDSRWLDADEASERVGARGMLGAVYTPHGAALHPASLVHGLAAVVERLGGTIHHHSPIVAVEPGAAIGESFRVSAPVVIRAVEAATDSLRSHGRLLVPVYSLMIATEPLPDAVWSELRWHRRETFNDARRLVIYAQRTADGRIAFGGRGAPYHWGSRRSPTFEIDDRVHQRLAATLLELFPALAGTRITHRWGGALGIARDWWPSIGFDRATGLGWAGGYVGDGVAMTHLAGRTLAALVDRTDDPVTRLPWVGHRSRKWEPEPFRWPAISASLRMAAAADDAETRTGRTSRLGPIIDRLTGG